MKEIPREPYDDITKEYLSYMKTRVSEQGYISLKVRIRKIVNWFYEEELLLEEVTVIDALKYKSYLGEYVTKEGASLSKGTICNYLKCVKSYFKYLVMTERRVSSPFEVIKYPKAEEHLTRNVLTELQMNSLLKELASYKSIREYKCHVLAELLYATGLRIAEAAALKPEDINTKTRMVYVKEGKGGKKRTAFLTSYGGEVLEQYLTKGREKVLRSYRGERRKEETLFGCAKETLAEHLNERLKEVCKLLELPIITSHCFRHSLGTHLLKRGCDLRHIKDILGHDKLSSTQVYTRVDKDDLKEGIDNFHPRKYHKEIAAKVV